MQHSTPGQGRFFHGASLPGLFHTGPCAPNLLNSSRRLFVVGINSRINSRAPPLRLVFEPKPVRVPGTQLHTIRPTFSIGVMASCHPFSIQYWPHGLMSPFLNSVSSPRGNVHGYGMAVCVVSLSSVKLRPSTYGIIRVVYGILHREVGVCVCAYGGGGGS